METEAIRSEEDAQKAYEEFVKELWLSRQAATRLMAIILNVESAK